ncbi:hypothetical protein [Pararhizobium mangrovi]|uniref:Uncharacterized protein n=1 Tax=Pararhizobium mangrovi TaxID=2590452 RepID=A0A506TYU2_9HYPH|nr:hypothetical protein [Pararhizobium mangrovi]TPW26378.1 hypothetical protein FJU11_14985 [Pararhizobium mangrovi]
MWAWLFKHTDILSVLLNAGMLVVWLAYLNFFFLAFREERKPKVLINRGEGSGLDGCCIISNMSTQPIYVESIIATVEIGDEQWSLAVTDISALEGDADRKKYTRQGPLARGQYQEIGSFRDLATRVLESHRGPDVAAYRSEQTSRIELKVIAIHSSEDMPIAAERKFDVVTNEEGKTYLQPQRVATRQIRTRRERRENLRLLETYM